MARLLQKNRKPTHPGRILSEHCMKPRGLSVIRLARALGVSRKHVSNIVHEHVNVTASMALRLSRVLGTTAQFWMNLQNSLNLFLAERRLNKQLENIRPMLRPSS